MTTVPATNSASTSLASIQQVIPQQQGVVMISMAPAGGPDKLGIMKRTTRWLGISQLWCGALIMLGGVVSANHLVGEQSRVRWTTVIGSAFWGGALMVVGGVIGIYSSKQQNSYKLNGVNMAFSIVGSLAGFINMAIFAFGVSVFSSNCRSRLESEPSYNTYQYQFCQSNQVGLAIHAVIMLLGLAEFIIGIVAAVLCCSALCQCCKQNKKLPAGQALMTMVGTDQPIMLSASPNQPIMMVSNQEKP